MLRDSVNNPEREKIKSAVTNFERATEMAVVHTTIAKNEWDRAAARWLEDERLARTQCKTFPHDT
jgi:hypothetical protein